jgi:hypothetical protein
MKCNAMAEAAFAPVDTAKSAAIILYTPATILPQCSKNATS